MTHTPRSYWATFSRNERITMTVVALLFVAIAGIYITLFDFHSSTRNQIAASNCTSIKCEAPIVRFVVGQVVAAEATGNQQVLGSNCALLASFQVSNPSKVTSAALSRYCTGKQGVSPGS